MANWQNPKQDYVGSDEVTPSIFNRLGENQQYLKDEQDKVKSTQQGVLSSLEDIAEQQQNQDERLDGLDDRADTLTQKDSELKADITDLDNRKIEPSDVQNCAVAITQATSRTNLGTNETVKSVFGKIKKWFIDLRSLAFKDTVSNADITDVHSSKVTGLHNVAKSGSYNDLNNKPSITKEAIGLGNVVNERQYSANHKPTKADVGLGNVDNIRQYSTSNPPPYPVTKVNNKVGAVTITKTDVGLSAVANERQYSSSNPPDRFKGSDTRNENNNPQWYMTNKGTTNIVNEFKFCNVIGTSSLFSGTYCQVVTFVSWGDASGGYPVQIAVASGSTCKMAIRTGTSSTAWSSWALFYNSQTLPPKATNSALGLVKGGGNVTINSDGSMTAQGGSGGLITVTARSGLGNYTNLDDVLNYISRVFTGSQTVSKIKANTFDSV